MARGIGGKYGLDQGTNPARGLFTNPVAAAPSSPRAGVGPVATVPGKGGVSATVGDTPAQAAQSAATPTYGAMSAGTVTESNRIGVM